MGVNGIYGLSGSGLDIESMVKVGMMSKQSEYDKMQQKFTKNEWTKAAYVDVYSKVQTFNNSTLSQYKMSANMNARNAESSNSEIKATANASAPQMTHYVEVGKAATNAYLIGTNSPTRIGTSKTSTQLRDTFMTDVSKNGNGSVVYYKDANGVQQQANSKDVAFSFTVGDGAKDSVNLTNSNSGVATVTVDDSAADGVYDVSVSQLATAASATGSLANMERYDGAGNVDSTSTSTQFKDLLFKELTISGNKVTSYTNLQGSSFTPSDLSAAGEAFGFTLSDGESEKEISVSYNKIDSGYSIDDLVNDINNLGLKVTASYDSSTQEFSLVHSETGSDSKINITTTYNNNGRQNYAGNTTAAFLTNLGLGSFTANTTTQVAQGTDAVATIDGEEVTSSTNSISKDGLNLELNSVGDTTIGVDRYEVDESKNTINITYGQLADGYTFNDLTVAVNNLGTNVKATYDSVNDKFSFYSSETGSENGVALKMNDDNATNFFNSLGLKQSNNGELSTNTLEFATDHTTGINGTNANVKIDGMDYDLADNKVVVNGVTYDFTGATEGAKSTVTVTQDTDKIIEKVKSFVEDYNKLLQSLTDMYNEKPNKNYKPLTDAQKDAMKDEQIEKWEEKAKAGLLYHDQTLGKLISEMRDAISTPIDGISGKYDSIFALGISTTGTKGQLTLDEDKLKAALADDSDAVYNVFAKLDEGEKVYKKDSSGNYILDANGEREYTLKERSSYNGIAQRLGDVFTNNMKNIKSVSGTDLNTNDDSDLSKLLRELQTKMSNFKAMMSAFEDKLYKKYDAMETALAKLGTQLNYVTSSFS